MDWNNKKERQAYNKEYDKKRYLENKEKILEAGKEYYKKNKEKIIALNSEYRKKNKEKLKVTRNKNQKDYIKKYPEKIKAHNIASCYIDIPKGQRCEICNIKEAKHKHHQDYSKPLEIIFVCVKCHADLHNNIGGK